MGENLPLPVNFVKIELEWKFIS